MGRRKKLRDLISILKDKASLIKATLSTKRTTSSIHIAVLRATPHSSSSSPPEHRVDAVLCLGNCSRLTACACIETIMDRLHNSRNTFVAFKCLIILHNIITRGSFILKDQLSFSPSGGGSNFLNLSRFRYDSDIKTTLDLSSWVRWYASVLERNLVTSRALGCYFSSSAIKIDRETDSTTSLLNSDLLREIDVLVGMVEEICRAPDSLHCQKNDLVFEVVRLVSEDYRSTQYQIYIRLSEFGHRMGGLSSGESGELTCCLKRLEECKERLVALFVNRKRNDDFWDLINHTKMKLVKVREERERQMVLVRMRTKAEAGESTRFRERIEAPSQLLRLPYGSKWLGVDGVHRLTVSTAMV
uniref:ENTH domain-containing protein n=1 Tax=Davidia involucrata TaxID=16924 RepID=A0A5B7CBM8_DAVIN